MVFAFRGSKIKLWRRSLPENALFVFWNIFLAYFDLVMNYFRVFCVYFIMAVLIIFRRIMLHNHASTFRIPRALASDEKNSLTKKEIQGNNSKRTKLQTYNWHGWLLYFLHTAHFDLYFYERTMIIVPTEHSLRSLKLPTKKKKEKKVNRGLNKTWN